MTDSEAKADAAATAPGVTYDPKAIFLEEWARTMPDDVRNDEAAHNVWEIVTEDRQSGTVLEPIPLNVFRLMARATANGWIGIELLTKAREHTEKADALKRVAMDDLAHLAKKAGCIAYDLKNGLIRECVHDDKREPKLKTIDVSGPTAKALVEILRKSGILGAG